MNPFDDLNKAFETKYAHDEETKFRVLMRRDKLFALWAAEVMGLSGDDAKAYVTSVLDAEIVSHAVATTVAGDLAAKGHTLPTADLIAKLQDCEAQAIAQVTPHPPANP